MADVTCQRCATALDDPDRALREAVSWQDVEPCCEETLELLRMERGMRRLLPDEEPPPYLDEILLKAAHARLPAGAKAPLAAVSTQATLFGKLRRWVTAPQVAMAMITGLAVVIGVFFLPTRFRPMEAEGDTLVTLDGTSSSAAPEIAEAPSDKPNADLQAGRLPSPMPAPSGSAAPASAVNAPAAAPAPVAPTATVAQAVDEESAAAPRREQLAEADGDYAAAPSPNDLLAGLDRGDTAESVLAEREAPSAAAAPSTSARRAMAMPATTASMASPPPAASGGGSVPGASAAGAAAPATTTGPATDAAARLAMARSYRARGQCAAAVPLYQQYLSDAAATERAEATLELGGCLERTGHLASARSTYERATRMPPVASRARASLEAMDAAEPPRASAAAPAAPAAEAAPSEPARRSRATEPRRSGSSSTEVMDDAWAN